MIVEPLSTPEQRDGTTKMAGTLGVDLEELLPLTMKRRFCATGLIK
jgi:hypothetical protein